MKQNQTRRDFLKVGGFTLLGAAGAAAMIQTSQPVEAAVSGQSYSALSALSESICRVETAPVKQTAPPGQMGHGPEDAMAMPVGEVDHARNGFNPTDILTEFDYGTVSVLEDGRTLREYEFNAVNKDIEVLPGMIYPAWTYNGRIPGPTIRCTEGDLLRIHFRNSSSHPHSMHFHGVHPAQMDGVPGTPGMIDPGESFTYEFDAEPFGMHLYHCHASPLARHIAKGLYGAFIIDPKEGRPPVDRELVMVMSGFDVDFDNENDFYAVNAIPFHYQLHPIQIRTGEKIRVYLVNILEYDLINSFHLHANFFHYYPTGTSLTPTEFTDTVMQTQAQRGILEFSYKYPGLYMFHAHNTEFAELGWTGNIEVAPSGGD